MTKIAFLFPGQGAQSVGMGQDLYQEYDFVREIFDMAEEISRLSLAKLCFQGPLERLTETISLQPAITAVNLSCLAALSKNHLQPQFSAGHSLGEFSALCAGGVIAAPDAVRLVCERGRLMHREAVKHPGIMHAIVNLPIQKITEIIERSGVGDSAAVANHNTETQIVITGEPAAVTKVSESAAAAGARFLPLKVSGAWHSKLMREAEAEFGDVLKTITFNSPQSRVIHNVTADFAQEPAEIRAIMQRQLCSPVRWYDSMQRLIAEGVNIFIEVGPGNVLRGLLKKILPKDYPARLFNVNSLKTMEACFADYEKLTAEEKQIAL